MYSQGSCKSVHLLVVVQYLWCTVVAAPPWRSVLVAQPRRTVVAVGAVAAHPQVQLPSSEWVGGSTDNIPAVLS